MDQKLVSKRESLSHLSTVPDPQFKYTAQQALPQLAPLGGAAFGGSKQKSEDFKN